MGVDEVAPEPLGGAERSTEPSLPEAPDTDPVLAVGGTAVVVLDRDGTLIDFVRDEELGFVGVAFHPAQLRLLPGVVEGLLLLQRNGFRLAIASNQPGPAKGQYSAEAIARTNQALCEQLALAGVSIDHVAICMHHPVGGPGGDPALVGACSCRKPQPGLLDEILEALDGDRERSWMIGDQLTDVSAAHATAMRAALLLDTRRCELCPHKPQATVPDPSCPHAQSGAAPQPELSAASFLALAEQLVATLPVAPEAQPH